MTEMKYRTIETANVPIKAWVEGVPFEPFAENQLRATARLPFIYKWVAAMPDVHAGLGSTIGSVIPTRKAIIPAAVGVDLGCGMMAVQTSMTAKQLPDNLTAVRSAIEAAVPHGRTSGRRGRDVGSWGNPPDRVLAAWSKLEARFAHICEKHPAIAKSNNLVHLGTLGTGNHFIELCLDEANRVWIMLHSGSRGVGNRIGTHFIRLAKKEMEAELGNLPNRDLAYFTENGRTFGDYVEAIGWAQEYARINREIMMAHIIEALRAVRKLPDFDTHLTAVNCHHNYAQKETHYGEEVWVTRKGAVRAGAGELGIIPGSMGARSYIVAGKGNPESFCSCSHGAGRRMSRTEAKRRFSVKDHVRATEGVECRKDAAVIDETPMAYKSIDDVMNAQSDLVDIVHTLRQVVCVKG